VISAGRIALDLEVPVARPRRRGRATGTSRSSAILPALITTTRSARATASATSCVTRTAVNFWASQMRS